MTDIDQAIAAMQSSADMNHLENASEYLIRAQGWLRQAKRELDRLDTETVGHDDINQACTAAFVTQAHVDAAWRTAYNRYFTRMHGDAA